MKYVLSLILGLLFVGAAALGIRSNRRLARNGVRTTARVVGLRESMGPPSPPSQSSYGQGLSQRVYQPVLAFHTADGREIQAVAGTASNPPLAQPGDVVQVLYDPANPATAEIDSVRGRGTAVIAIIGAIGIGLIVFALYHLL